MITTGQRQDLNDNYRTKARIEKWLQTKGNKWMINTDQRQGVNDNYSPKARCEW